MQAIPWTGPACAFGAFTHGRFAGRLKSLQAPAQSLQAGAARIANRPLQPSTRRLKRTDTSGNSRETHLRPRPDILRSHLKLT